MKHSFIFITAFVAKFLESCNDSCQKALCQHRMGLKFLFLTMMMVVHVPLIMYAQMRTTTYNKEIQGYENSQVDNGCYYLIA